MDKEVLELINRRRHQILVHSYIYYRLNMNLVSDTVFDNWCMELVDLQSKHPKESAKAVYYEDFKDFDGSSGFNLPYYLHNIASRAEGLIISKKKYDSI